MQDVREWLRNGGLRDILALEREKEVGCAGDSRKTVRKAVRDAEDDSSKAIQGGALMIAALFVESEGCYYGLDNVDPWDVIRDARTYAGPYPVVAHPPCQLWTNMASVNYARWGGEHNRPGNDGGMFRFALDTVRRCGGVLEHPAKSRAWAAHGLTKPNGEGWQRCDHGGFVCEVWQSAYGHRANKATWLYLVGEPLPLRWDRPTGTHQVGFHDQRGKARNKPTLGRREANATPPEFAAALVELARRCSKHNVAQRSR
jgi:hypothetical protein